MQFDVTDLCGLSLSKRINVQGLKGVGNKLSKATQYVTDKAKSTVSDSPRSQSGANIFFPSWLCQFSRHCLYCLDHATVFALKLLYTPQIETACRRWSQFSFHRLTACSTYVVRVRRPTIPILREACVHQNTETFLHPAGLNLIYWMESRWAHHRHHLSTILWIRSAVDYKIEAERFWV